MFSKIKNIFKRISVGALATLITFTSMNLSGIGMVNTYAANSYTVNSPGNYSYTNGDTVTVNFTGTLTMYTSNNPCYVAAKYNNGSFSTVISATTSGSYDFSSGVTLRFANGGGKSFVAHCTFSKPHSHNSSGSKSYGSTTTNTTTYCYYTYCNGHGDDTSQNKNDVAHSFTSQNTDAAYLKSEADCEHDAVYYYKCANCPAKGTSTWANTGSALGHSYAT